MAKTYGTRPSQILGIDDPWLAYQLDEVVMRAGLRPGPTTASPKQQRETHTQFGSVKKLARHGARRAKVPKSGVW
jgi:hypothetical protein